MLRRRWEIAAIRIRGLRRSILILALLGLAGCGGGGGTLPPAAAHPAAASRSAADTATGLPGDTATGLPGDTATGLPGDTATGLPGAQLACAPVPQNGQASCTIAINLHVAPLTDPNTPASLIPGLHPADLQRAYGLSSAGSGGTVAVVDAYDDPLAEADLAIYRAAFGLPACTSANGCLRKIDQHGGSAYPAPNAAWAQEIALDLDMVSAACPSCAIVLVEANSAGIDDLGAAVDTAAALGVRAVSNSYYAAEWAGETAEDAHYAHGGVALTVSAGDTTSPSYPATSPGVLAVGGTSLGGGAESAWAYGARGCSAYEKKPSWQAASPCATRAAVDVAAVGDPQTGVSMFASASGGWLVAGGTSVGAPLIAAAAAQNGSFAGPWYPYAHPAAFHDILPAGVDAVTGLGSPNGTSGL